jgi:hypothetical protein
MSVSKLELVLATCTQNDGIFLNTFFFHWPVQSILRLARTSLLLYAVTKSYVSNAWNVSKFLRFWFKNPRIMLKALDCGQALLYGDNVLRYFHRARPSVSGPLDLCVMLSHVTSILRPLAKEKYEFYQTKPGCATTFARALHLSITCGNSSRSTAGERSTRTIDHAPYVFYFQKLVHASDGGTMKRTIRVNVVRCEPYRHVLAQHSS